MSTHEPKFEKLARWSLLLLAAPVTALSAPTGE
jgi:hypothetical protein